MFHLQTLSTKDWGKLVYALKHIDFRSWQYAKETKYPNGGFSDPKYTKAPLINIL